MTHILHTDNPPELVIRLDHPKIKSHKMCVRPGMAGWKLDGTPLPCGCVVRLMQKEWNHLFPRKGIKTIKFTEESVIVN